MKIKFKTLQLPYQAQSYVFYIKRKNKPYKKIPANIKVHKSRARRKTLKNNNIFI